MPASSPSKALSKKAKLNIREMFIEGLQKNKIDPIKNIADLLKATATPVEVKANINLGLLKLLVPPPPKEEEKGDNELKISITDFSRTTEVSVSQGHPDAGARPIQEAKVLEG